MNEVWIFFSMDAASLAETLCRSALVDDIEKSRNKRGGKKIYNEAGRNCTILGRIVSPGGYGVYALKAF